MRYRKDIQLVDEDSISVSEAVAALFCGVDYIPQDLVIYNKDTGLMTYCIDAHRRPSGSIERYRTYGVWDMLIKGAQVRLSLPVPLLDNGQHKDIPLAVGLEAISEHTNRPPFVLDEKSGARLVEYTREYIYNYESKSRWSDYMRPVAAINSLRKMLGMTLLTQDITNDMLSKIPDIIDSMKYHCDFITGNISDVYASESDSQFGSCMAGEDQSRFELYDYLQRIGKLGMITITNGRGEHSGRALVWYGTNPDDLYLDRVYAHTRNSVKLRAVLDVVKEFCAANNINKCVHDSCIGEIGLEFRNIRISLGGAGHYNFSEYPYVDSMRYWYSDGCLRNRKSSSIDGCYLVGSLDQTDGSGDFEDDENMVTLHHGGRSHIDDAIYVDRHGEWYCNDDVVCTHNGDYELREDCGLLDESNYGRRAWAHDDDITEAHNGENILSDDAVEIGNENSGEYAHTDDAVEMPDGIYLLYTDPRVKRDEQGNYVYADTEAGTEVEA